MTGTFKDITKDYLLRTPIRDLREETLSRLYEMVDLLSFVSEAKDGDIDLTSVFPNLYASLQDGGETSEHVDLEALKERNYELLCKARDRVMPGWGGVYGDA